MQYIIGHKIGQLSQIIAILLSSIYILRVINKKKFRNQVLSKLHKILRRQHKTMGILLIITGLVHGILSGYSIFSFNSGTIALVLSILLGLNFMARKKLSKLKPWIYYHRILAGIFLITMILHII